MVIGYFNTHLNFNEVFMARIFENAVKFDGFVLMLF